MNKDWIKINRTELTKWLTEHYDHSKELAITLPDQDVPGRSQAIVEARTYKKLMVEIESICGNKPKEIKDNI